MPAPVRFFVSLAAIAVSLRAAAPAELTAALDALRSQKSYSWEVINADPGPVAQQYETRRGKVTTVQQNTSPHVKASVALNGDRLFQRDWADGLKLETIVTADGTMVTNTPEGWMTDREILSALAEERLRAQNATPRFVWLRRADRPDVRRPDQELAGVEKFRDIEAAGESYVARARLRADGATKTAGEDDGEPAFDVTITMNLRGGFIRDYEVKIEGTRRATRLRVPVAVSDQHIVIITYLPVGKIDIPPEAREKLESARLPAARQEARD